VGVGVLTCPSCAFHVHESDGYCEGCGFRLIPPQPQARDHVEVDLPGVAGVSNRGLHHHRNEDAMGANGYQRGPEPDADGGKAAVVCDGISNSPRPDVASQVAAEVGTQALIDRLVAGDAAGVATIAAANSAGRAVSALATSPDDAPACTYVSAVVEQAAVTVGWVGDSRAYWLAGDETTRSVALTSDDSLVNHLSESGEMTREEASRQPNGGALVRWLGADAEDAGARVVSVEPGAPGAVLICSDGLWNYLPEAHALAAAVPDAAKEPMTAARTLVRLALDAGGHDNVTVVVIPFPPEGVFRR
jgi:serine/threonine protein phosphatase PrpC